MKASFTVEKLLAALKMEKIIRTKHNDKTVTVEGSSVSGSVVETIMVHVKKEVVKIISYELYDFEGPNSPSIRVHNTKMANPKALVITVKAMRKILKFEPDVTRD